VPTRKKIKSIFFIEDSITGRSITREAFKRIEEKTDSTLVITYISTGREFIKRIQKERAPPDMILMDYHLPVLDASDIFEILSKDESWSRIRKIPTIVFTSIPKFPEYVLLEKYNINASIEKPISTKELEGLLKCLIRIWLIK